MGNRSLNIVLLPPRWNSSSVVLRSYSKDVNAYDIIHTFSLRSFALFYCAVDLSEFSQVQPLSVNDIKAGQVPGYPDQSGMPNQTLPNYLKLRQHES